MAFSVCTRRICDWQAVLGQGMLVGLRIIPRKLSDFVLSRSAPGTPDVSSFVATVESPAYPCLHPEKE